VSRWGVLNREVRKSEIVRTSRLSKIPNQIKKHKKKTGSYFRPPSFFKILVFGWMDHDHDVALRY
jgi:hypothetical protein